MPGRKRKHNLNGEFLLLYNNGYSDYAIARMQKCREGVVWQWRKKNNLPVKSTTPYNKGIIQRVNPTQHFDFRSFVEIIDKAIEDAGVSLHSIEGRKCRDGLFRRFEGVFKQEWQRT